MKEKLTLKTVSLILLGLVAIGGVVYGGRILLGKDNPDSDQDQTEVSENPQTNPNDQNQNTGDPDQTEAKAFDSTIEDLSNGWKLYTNRTLGFSVEFPQNWHVTENSQSSVTIMNKDPEQEGVFRLNDLLSVSVISKLREINNTNEFRISGYYPGEEEIIVHSLKEYYEKLFSYDEEGFKSSGEIDMPDHFTAAEVTVSGKPAKRVWSIGEAGVATEYFIPVNEFSDLIDLSFFRQRVACSQNFSDPTEYQHMLESFRVL